MYVALSLERYNQGASHDIITRTGVAIMGAQPFCYMVSTDIK
jgi:hypothetical protein